MNGLIWTIYEYVAVHPFHCLIKAIRGLILLYLPYFEKVHGQVITRLLETMGAIEICLTNESSNCSEIPQITRLLFKSSPLLNLGVH
jgi:hypothetical protein